MTHQHDTRNSDSPSENVKCLGCKIRVRAIFAVALAALCVVLALERHAILEIVSPRHTVVGEWTWYPEPQCSISSHGVTGDVEFVACIAAVRMRKTLSVVALYPDLRLPCAGYSWDGTKKWMKRTTPYLFDESTMTSEEEACGHCPNSTLPQHLCCGVCQFEKRQCSKLYPGAARGSFGWEDGAREEDARPAKEERGEQMQIPLREVCPGSFMQARTSRKRCWLAFCKTTPL